MMLRNSIAFFVVTIVATLVVTLVATLVAWNLQIEHRAFQCTDNIGFGTFWEDMAMHERAGDTVSPGWSWDEIKHVEATYKRAFFLIWFAGTLAGSVIIFWKRRHEKKSTLANR
jgi:hypothetical protein